MTPFIDAIYRITGVNMNDNYRSQTALGKWPCLIKIPGPSPLATTLWRNCRPFD